MIPAGGALALLASAALVLGGCGGDEAADEVGTDAGTTAPSPSSDEPSAEQPGLTGDMIVFAAASLTETFAELSTTFQQEHPEVTVTVNPAASSALAQQIVAGAPADVFASASPATMATVTDAGLADGEPVIFVRNRLQIATPPDNPGGVTGLADFAKPELTIALCAEQVPCGAAALKAFAAAGITPAPDTLEQDVRATLSKVELGEVDAALVYRTDVIAAGDAVAGIDFPESEEAINDYPIAALADAPNPEAAAAFVELVLSEEGQEVFAAAGFDSP